jgi:ABC-2 type transport system ATP-binding protein
VLQAIGLSKRYEDGVLALDELNLEVPAGSCYALLGANGAGKTTTMNLFLGFLAPTAGRALVQGIDVHERPLEAKNHLAYLPESVMLYGNLTAMQNLRFFAALAGQELDRDACTALFAEVGLQAGAENRKLREFSKGMRQKVGIAIAVAKRAPALLLDEPTSGLDPQAAAELCEVLRRQKQHGSAILMNTHDVFRARELADTVGIMRAGKLLTEMTRREFATANLESIYLRTMGQTSAAAAPGSSPAVAAASCP